MSEAGKSEGRLEKGLREAFRKLKPGSSILQRIASRQGSAPQVNLRDVAGETTPVVKPGGKGSKPESERYQVVGEIARGGVGIVFKGRDVDLGRDVAMKVLLDEHGDRAELIERFVEEAQIGGQLQHPGIVPVYEIGLQEDGRPFFAMKLVKGRTLSALLLDRKSPQSERRRFLSIFEQVCHTMAYAHARGVIHRDLKPSNVMVGAFGEVLVVDWGLAKVLAQGGVADEARTEIDRSIIATERSGSGTDSVAGSVLGTPGYMPPEQARGDRENLDERADVFSLGSILAEILTGKPAFADGNTLEMAAVGHLAPAYERLDGCGADAELIDLAKRCLAKEPGDRPRHAGELAEAIGGYLTSVEERAQEARVEAAEARVREHEERRAKKLTLALAATIFLAIASGGGIFYRAERQERERVEQAGDRVAQALVVASEKLGAARSAGTDDLTRWPAAIREAERAVEIARAGEADEAASDRARAFLAETKAAEAEARAAAEARERDRAAVSALTAARLMRGDDFERDDVNAAFEKAFSDYGIEVDELTVDELVARVDRSRVREELVGALDAWSHARDPEDVEGLNRLREAVRRLDPDPWRTKVRLLDEAEKISRLHELADADPSERGATSLCILATTLARQGSTQRARDLLRIAVERDDCDFWTNLELVLVDASGSQPDWQLLDNRFEALLEERPDAYGVAYHFGGMLRSRAPDRAIELWMDVHRANPGYGAVKRNLMGLLEGRIRKLQTDFDWTSMQGVARLMLEIEPDDPSTQAALGSALSKSHTGVAERVHTPLSEGVERDLDEAIALLELATERDKTHRPALWGALMNRHRWNRALEVAREMTREADDPTVEHGWLLIGTVYRTTGDPERAVDAYQRCVAVGHECPRAASARVHVQNLLRQLQRAPEAIRIARARIRIHPEDQGAYVHLAISLICMGRFEDAERVLGRVPGSWPEALAYLGTCKALRGDLDGAADAWRRLQTLLKQWEKSHEQQGRPSDRLRNGILQMLRAQAEMLELFKSWEAHLHLVRELRKWTPEFYFNEEIEGLQRLGRNEEVLALLLERVKTDPFHLGHHKSIFNALHESKELDAHAKRLERRVAADESDPVVWLLLGHVRVAQDRLDDAMAAYERVIRLKPRLYVTHMMVLYALVHRGDSDQRLAAVRRAIDANPEAFVAWMNLGGSLDSAGEFEGARDAFDRAFRFRAAAGQAVPLKLLARRARIECKLGGPESGLAYARERFLIRPHGPAGAEEFVAFLANEGETEFALFCLEDLLRRNPESVLTRCNILWVLALASDEDWDPERALRLSDEATERMEDSGAVWTVRAVMLARAGRYEESVAAFERRDELVGELPLMSHFRWFRAIALWQVGRKEEAREVLRSAEDAVLESFRNSFERATFARRDSEFLKGPVRALRAKAHAIIK